MKRRLLAGLLCTLLAAAPAVAAPRVLDPAASEIGFSVKQMGVEVSGHFRRYEARIDFDPAAPESASAELRVEVASLTTGDADTDGVARDRPWLDSAGFPQAEFRSSAVRALGGNRYEARGQLRLKGRAREVVVPFTCQAQPGGSLLLSGQLLLRRADFGIGGGEWNEGDLVANEVPLRFRLRLLPAP
jgi:polyisoprenoid-binding protein YceI